ncbi:mitogen-activated protein kinase kinase kinase 3 [Canna indica]|uniref:Mitogen-activated protein kinase kinase kinase 3 n=1 Tax=Canna indica TaxID=4628 RepID=A0AAQ3QMD7_9LILI|nr:mitogen-activated protein kinase kinase kinase 3 [Canna indica]
MESTTKSWVRGCPIGAGAFGAVHLAFDKSASQVFAVKSVSLSSSPLPFIQFLENEIQVLKSIRSPYVVSYLGDDTSHEPRAGARRNLHIEYMPGGTVADAAAAARAEGRPLDELQVRSHARCVARALRYLHDVAGVVHCDVKGRNVLLARDRRVAKLADFGMAVRTAGGGGGWVRGTPLWMAPEVARGERPSPAADVWSLGCTVIEMVTGAQPWANLGGKGASGAMLSIGYGGEVPEFPAQLSDVGRDFLDKCLRRDAKERWTAEQLLQHPFLAKEGAVVGDASPRGVLEWANWGFHEDEYDSIEGRCSLESARDRMRGLGVHGGASSWCSDDWELVRCSEETNSVAEDEEEEEEEKREGLGGGDDSVGGDSGSGIGCSASCCCLCFCCNCCHSFQCCCCRRRCRESDLGGQNCGGKSKSSVFELYDLLSKEKEINEILDSFKLLCPAEEFDQSKKINFLTDKPGQTLTPNIGRDMLHPEYQEIAMQHITLWAD